MISSQGLNFLWWAAYVWAASVSAGTLVDLAPSHSASSSHYDSLGTEPVKTDQSVHKKERDSRLFGKEKTDDSLFSQIYFDLPENEEVPVDRKKFSAWLETFSQRPGFADPENSQERKELVSYLEAASFRDLSLLLEKLEKTALKNRKEKSFKDEVSKIYQRKLNQNEKEVDRLQAFLKNPGATNPVAALWDTSEVQGLASVDMTPEEMVKPLMQGRGLQLDPTKFKKLLVLGGTMGNDGKAVEDPSLRFTEYEVTADGKLKEIRKSKKASAQVADIQHSFSDEDLKQAHPGVVAGFLIGAGKHALPAATNLVALAGPPGVAVAGSRGRLCARLQ
ncbi:MAG: hypothetical protein EBZ49_05555, partial [Proteobacteria bacterium]|nr:hypothetical protein [Pseudomonadota bacterium]